MTKLQVLALQLNTICWIGFWAEWFIWGKDPVWVIAFGIGITLTGLYITNKE